MRARLAMVGATVLALGGLGTLAGCSDGDQRDPGMATVTVTASSKPAASTPAGTAAVDETTYIKALRNLDADLVTNEKAALDNGYQLCEAAGRGASTSDQVGGAIELFSVDGRRAQRIVAIATANLCAPA